VLESRILHGRGRNRGGKTDECRSTEEGLTRTTSNTLPSECPDSDQGGAVNEGTCGRSSSHDSSEQRVRTTYIVNHRMGTMSYEIMEKHNSLERRSRRGMSTTPTGQHQPARTKNKGPRRRPAATDTWFVFDLTVSLGSTQPSELLEDINGLEGTEFELERGGRSVDGKNPRMLSNCTQSGRRRRTFQGHSLCRAATRNQNHIRPTAKHGRALDNTTLTTHQSVKPNACLPTRHNSTQLT